MQPLFRRFPAIVERVPYVSLGSFPTPVEAREISGVPLWVKRDDLSAEPYGGNKVRKLEFLLGDALATGAREVITFGAAGSNHALATAIYARQLGLSPIVVLAPQHSADYVRQNLLAHVTGGTDVRFVDDFIGGGDRAIVGILRERQAATGQRPYVIGFGGTSPLSTLGFVNAGLELAEQVAAGALPTPDVVYVPLGSMGTAAGLIIGLAIAGLPTKVIAVRVVPDQVADDAKLGTLLAETLKVLEDAGADGVPHLEDLTPRYEVRDEQFGEGYAVFTPQGIAAIDAAEAADVHLEGTYTGKTMAALLADAATAATAASQGRTPLFWNTYNSRDMTALIGDPDWRALPEPLWRYFSEGAPHSRS